MWRVGLTGGIGSGKSTVAAAFQARGAAVIDVDAVSRQVTAAGGAAIDAVGRQFGPWAIKADGAMDRDAMRALIVRDPDARRQLEAIVHPLVRCETAARTAAAAASGQRCLVVDIPLLVESGRWRAQLDRIVVIDCQVDTQIARVMARQAGPTGWTVDAVKQIIAAQASRAQRLSAADICLYNEGISLDVLSRWVDQVADGFGL